MQRSSMILTSLCFLGALAIAACEKGDGKAGDGKTADAKAADAKGDTKPAAAKNETKKLDKVGLSVELPPDSTVSDGMGDNSAMVSVPGAALTISVAKDTDPKTVDDGKNGALLGDKGRNLKGDKIADGWIVTWENTGSMGDNYWLTMRREIGGKGYMCETMQSNEEQRQKAIALCKSLKP